MIHGIKMLIFCGGGTKRAPSLQPTKPARFSSSLGLRAIRKLRTSFTTYWNKCEFFGGLMQRIPFAQYEVYIIRLQYGQKYIPEKRELFEAACFWIIYVGCQNMNIFFNLYLYFNSNTIKTFVKKQQKKINLPDHENILLIGRHILHRSL